jgi:hyaluronoglucosaminidase
VEFIHRGVVEGFYGPPFSQDARLWLIERLGRWGMNRYVYAPKNDPLHRDRWREPYPETTLREFATLLEHGAKHGVSVAFALSPGLSIRYSEKADVAHLVEKLSGFTQIGARSLALFLDDVPSHLTHEEDRRAFGSLGEAHVTLAARVQEALGPDIAWWLCPTDYLGTGSSEYLETLGVGLSPEIEVGWTGRTVCSPSILRVEALARAAALRRRLLIWDNVPVSDGPMRFMLHLGPYGRRDPDLAQAVCGVLLNPMQHAHASAVALHTAAAYLADPHHYDPERAWREALEEIGAGAPEAFQLFAKAHRFSPIWDDHRDRELEDGLDALRAALRGGDAARIVAELRPLCDQRLAAGDVLRSQLLDRDLAEEIEPWLESHRAESQRIAWALDAVASLVSALPAARKITALFGLELRLGSEPEPRHVSYGPRRVLYPQLTSMAEEGMGFGEDPALVRGRCLADAFVALAEELALEQLCRSGSTR